MLLQVGECLGMPTHDPLVTLALGRGHADRNLAGDLQGDHEETQEPQDALAAASRRLLDLKVRDSGNRDLSAPLR